MLSFWRHPIIFIRRLLLPTCKTCINHYGERGTGFCDCQKYRDRYEKLEGDELERTHRLGECTRMPHRARCRRRVRA